MKEKLVSPDKTRTNTERLVGRLLAHQQHVLSDKNNRLWIRVYNRLWIRVLGHEEHVLSAQQVMSISCQAAQQVIRKAHRESIHAGYPANIASQHMLPVAKKVLVCNVAVEESTGYEHVLSGNTTGYDNTTGYGLGCWG